jgi:hypothetical protein
MTSFLKRTVGYNGYVQYPYNDTERQKIVREFIKNSPYDTVVGFARDTEVTMLESQCKQLVLISARDSLVLLQRRSRENTLVKTGQFPEDATGLSRSAIAVLQGRATVDCLFLDGDFGFERSLKALNKAVSHYDPLFKDRLVTLISYQSGRGTRNASYGLEQPINKWKKVLSRIGSTRLLAKGESVSDPANHWAFFWTTLL